MDHSDIRCMPMQTDVTMLQLLHLLMNLFLFLQKLSEAFRDKPMQSSEWPLTNHNSPRLFEASQFSLQDVLQAKRTFHLQT